jgi:hypothetical protein
MTNDEKTMGLLAHAGGILLGFLAPLLVLLLKGNESVAIKRMSTEALNFQITIAIAYFVSFLLWAVLIGTLLTFIVWVLALVFAIIAAVAVNNGQEYTYPFAIRLVK